MMVMMLVMLMMMIMMTIHIGLGYFLYKRKKAPKCHLFTTLTEKGKISK